MAANGGWCSFAEVRSIAYFVHLLVFLSYRSAATGSQQHFNLMAFSLTNPVWLQVAIWHPTFYFPIERNNTQASSEVASQPTEQLQAVETEKRRLQLQGIAIADEIEAFNFFEQHKATICRQKKIGQSRDVASYWDPDQQVLGGNVAESEAESPMPQSLEYELHQLANAVTVALPGTRQQRQARAFHPATALSTALVELLPVEDIVLEERLESPVSGNSNSGSKHARQQAKATACIHFRYAAQTVYRLLPLVAQPSESLVQRMQQCRQEIFEAAEAHEKSTWTRGEDVICIASSQGQELPQGVAGTLEDSPGADASRLSVRVPSWRNEPPRLQQQLEDACKAICAGDKVCLSK